MQIIDGIKSWWSGLFEKKAIGNRLATFFGEIFPSWFSWKEAKTFKTVDDIFSVVDRLATVCATIPLWGYTEKGKDLPEGDEFARFLRTLTYAQRYQMFLWYWLRGECFMYKEKILGARARVESLHFLNPTYVTIIISREFPFKITGYRYNNTSAGIDIRLEADEVIFVKDFNPDNDIEQSFRGLGRIQVLAKRLTKMKANMDNSVSQMQNGGVPGIVFEEGDLAEGALGERKDKFARFLRSSDNKGAPFFAGGKMGYIRLGLSTVELDAIKADLTDFKKVCNVFRLSDRLFNNDATGSEVSDDNAQKSMYTVACMPATTLFEEALSAELAPDFAGIVRICKFDYSGIKILQDDQLKIAQAFAAAPVVKPNAALIAMGEPPSTDPLMEKYYFKTGYTPIEDVGGADMIGDEPQI